MGVDQPPFGNARDGQRKVERDEKKLLEKKNVPRTLLSNWEMKRGRRKEGRWGDEKVTGEKGKKEGRRGKR